MRTTLVVALTLSALVVACGGSPAQPPQTPQTPERPRTPEEVCQGPCDGVIGNWPDAGTDGGP
ncbi:MAG: hypothetical protein ACOZQL_19415 [Myxococcota bacterium]